MLFLVWLAAAFIVVAAINLYLRHFGLPRITSAASGSTAYVSTAVGGTPRVGVSGGWLMGGAKAAVGGETVNWFNAAVAWMHQRCNQTPDFVDAWLRALTIEADRLQHQTNTSGSGTQVQLRFDGVHGSAPDVSNVQADLTSSDQYTLYATVSVKEAMLQLCCLAHSTPTSPSSPSSPTPLASPQAVNCDVRLQWLKGQIKLVVKLINNELSLNISFVQPPEIKLQVRPIRTNTPLDTALVENAVRGAIGGATTNISWQSRPSGHVGPGGVARPQGGGDYGQDRSQLPQMRQQQSYGAQGSTFRDHAPSSQGTFSSPLGGPGYPSSPQAGPGYSSPLGAAGYGSPAGLAGGQMSPSSDVTQQAANLSYGANRPGQLGQQLGQQLSQQQQQQQLRGLGSSLGGDRPLQRLLVKVIKANGLVDTDWGSCNAYCLVKLDQPAQSFMTNVIRNTVNPLWDEQFVFDVDSQTKLIQFEVLDRDKQPDNDLLGKAVVVLDEVRRMPSSRQIIPLTGRPRSRTSTSGSVTVELVFLDSLECSAPAGPLLTNNYNATPTQGQQGLSGTQPQDRLAQGSTFYSDQNKSPSTASTTISGDLGNYPARGRGAGQVGGDLGAPLSAHDLALTSTHPGSPQRSQDSPALVITGTETQRGNTMQIGVRPNLDAKGKEKKESFAATLKKKFALKKGTRAQSVDRYQSSSMRDSSLLKPPGQQDQQGQQRLADDPNLQYNEGRQVRSNSFGSSLRRMFRTKDKKSISRDSSLTRSVGRGGPQQEIVRDGPFGLQGSHERSHRQGTPVPPGKEDYTTDQRYGYSTSVPANKSSLGY